MAFEITDENLNEVKGANDVVLVDVWAEWCGPCKMLGPVIDEIAEDNKDTEGLIIGKANVDENNEIATQYGVRSIPTVIIFKNGEEVARSVGAQPKKYYEELIEKFTGETAGEES